MRELIEFPKLRWGMRSKSRKLGVKKLPANKREARQVLILGTGRCGTTTIAKMLTKAGLDVQREKVGAQGTASLYFITDSEWYPAWHWEDRVHVGERRSDFIFANVLHVVRHPAKTIPSMGAVFPALNYEFFEENDIIPQGIKSQLHRCAYAYYEINRRAEEQAEQGRFRIEDLKKAWSNIMSILGEDPDKPMPELLQANRATGYRKREPLDLRKIRDLDAGLYAGIRKQMLGYGYKEL